MAKFNQEIIDKICVLLENGTTQKDAATLVGIDEKTFYRWLKKRQFFQSVKLAESNYIEKMVKVVTDKSQSEPSGRLAMEILARRRPDDWGEKIKNEHDFKGHVSVTFKVPKNGRRSDLD